MSWETTATYGAMSPFWFGGRMGTLHKERRSVTQHDRDHTDSFTQVRAAARRKTLLLLWWIDGGMSVVVHNTLARQGFPRGHCDYAYGGLGSSTFQPFSMIAMGLHL